MSYRPPSRQPRGSWARHLHEQRRLRDLSQTQAFEAVFERIGWSSKSRTAYVAIDMGERQPKPDEAKVLAEEFGWPPDPEINDDLEDASLASALLALTGELRAAREERAEVARRLTVMEARLAVVGEMERYLASLPEATRLSLRPKAAAPNHETPAQ